jgi:hypothetical protein
MQLPISLIYKVYDITSDNLLSFVKRKMEKSAFTVYYLDDNNSVLSYNLIKQELCFRLFKFGIGVVFETSFKDCFAIEDIQKLADLSPTSNLLKSKMVRATIIEESEGYFSLNIEVADVLVLNQKINIAKRFIQSQICHLKKTHYCFNLDGYGAKAKIELFNKKTRVLVAFNSQEDKDSFDIYKALPELKEFVVLIKDEAKLSARDDVHIQDSIDSSVYNKT